MDKLRLFIEKNREAFDREELPAGHTERFGRKLPVRRRRVLQPVRLVAGAAAAVLLFALLFPFRRPGECPEADVADDGLIMELPDGSAGRIAAEIDDLCGYRTRQMHEMVDRIRGASVWDSLAKSQVLEESVRILTAGRQFEETVVPQLPRTEEALNAMNRFYLTNLESLGFMLRLLEESGCSDSAF